MTQPEEDGSFELNTDGETWLCNRDNTSLWTFTGKVVLRGMEMAAENVNHVFHIYGEEEDGTTQAIYIFQNAKGFLALHNFLLRNGYPAHLNLRDVAQCDLDAWENSTFQDLGDEIPDGWDEPRS